MPFSCQSKDPYPFSIVKSSGPYENPPQFSRTQKIAELSVRLCLVISAELAVDPAMK